METTSAAPLALAPAFDQPHENVKEVTHMLIH